MEIIFHSKVKWRSFPSEPYHVPKQWFTPTCEMEENMTILQIERDLRVRLEVLTKQKTDRLEELKILQQKDQELCSDLCVTPYYIPSGSIPSLQQLEELKEHIKVQTEEKRKRLEAFSALRTEIRQCLDDIGRQPENSLEQDAICEDEEAFFLTQENIKALTVLKAQLELRKEALLSTLNTVKEKVLSLWDLLQVTQEEREACGKVSGRSISEELRMWESELARLEELKMANLKQVILNIRKELKDYWDKCFYTLEQTKTFAPYYCGQGPGSQSPGGTGLWIFRAGLRVPSHTAISIATTVRFVTFQRYRYDIAVSDTQQRSGILLRIPAVSECEKQTARDLTDTR
ncbi:unnamed protein product, partial [Ranitomeya imitator]